MSAAAGPAAESLPDPPAERFFALVPCAGVGSRSGAVVPKQYVRLAGRAAVAHTLEALAAVPRLSGILVVLSAEDDQFEAEVPSFRGAKAWVERCGGDTRAATVDAGLDALRQRGVGENDWVLVHDAARCLLRSEWVSRLISACESDDVGGLLALPVADTLKESRGERVSATLSRSGKWMAQTPQMFRWGLLRRALAAAGDSVTDESSAIEQLGLCPQLVRGSLENLKVTYPEDFPLAERLLASRVPGDVS